MGAYHPVGEPLARSATTGKFILPAVAERTYTQTYSTALRTVPAATVAALALTVAADAPAGGTGAAAGCYDTSGNRNTAITTMQENRLLALSLKTQINALRVDVAALFAVANALANDLRRAGVVG